MNSNSTDLKSADDLVLQGNEFLRVIFEYLHKSDLVNIRLVCRQWRRNCKSFFKQVKFIGNTVLNPDEIPPNLFEDFIREKDAILDHYEGNFEYVQEFECYGWSNHQVMNFFASNFPNIKTLYLHYVTDLDGSINRSELLFPKLNHLTVESVVMGTIPANVLFASPINLKTLDLIHLSDSGEYPRVFGFARQLSELNISFMAYNPSVVAGIAMYLHQLKKLTLILHWVTDTDSPHEIFQNCSQLESIVLSVDCDLAKSLYYIAHNNPLAKKTLCLLDNKHMNIPNLLSVMENCTNLTKLEFQNCPTLNQDVLESIATHLPNLIWFKLEQPNLIASWVIFILSKFKHLKYLHLIALPPISVPLTSSWSCTHYLTHLYLRGINFSPLFDLVSLDFPNLERCEINGKRLL